MGNFDWIKPLESEIIDRDHPEWEYWQEVLAVERIVDSGPPRGDAEPAEAPPMPRPPRRPEAPPPTARAVGRVLAAELLDISVDSFERHVLPDLRVVQVGRRQVVSLRELDAWLESKSARALRG